MYGGGGKTLPSGSRDRRVAIWATVDKALKTDLEAIHDADRQAQAIRLDRASWSEALRSTAVYEQTQGQ